MAARSSRAGQARARFAVRVHRGLLQQNAAALHPRLPHPGRGNCRIPGRSDNCMISNPGNFQNPRHSSAEDRGYQRGHVRLPGGRAPDFVRNDARERVLMLVHDQLDSGQVIRERLSPLPSCKASITTGRSTIFNGDRALGRAVGRRRYRRAETLGAPRFILRNKRLSSAGVSRQNDWPERSLRFLARS